jgi:cytochrome c biogenesis protein CcmG, thiol:disulfide interchange protein DsbE
VEYPHLQQINANRGGDDFVLLSIDTANRPDLDMDFVKKVGATFPIALDDAKVSREVFKIKGTPTNLLIDRQGRIVFRHLGFSPGQEKVLDAEVQLLMRS